MFQKLYIEFELYQTVWWELSFIIELLHDEAHALKLCFQSRSLAKHVLKRGGKLFGVYLGYMNFMRIPSLFLV